MQEATNPIQFLQDEFSRRMKQNPRYSMRAFAKSLGLNVGSLSGILSGKRTLTVKSANAIFDRLAVEPSKKAKLCASLISLDLNLGGPDAEVFLKNRVEIDQQIFEVISEWYHYGILQLIRTDGYQEQAPENHTKWFASQLGITEGEASIAINRLLQLEIVKFESGRLVRLKDRLTTSQKDTTTGALRKLQKQIREKAIESLEQDPIETRSMTSLTIAIDPAKIPQARKLIDEFQERLSAMLGIEKKEQVYQLEVSLFPLQKKVLK